MQLGVSFFEKKKERKKKPSRSLKEQMSWDALSKQNKNPQSILLSLALHQ